VAQEQGVEETRERRKRFGLRSNQIYNWKKQFLDGGRCFRGRQHGHGGAISEAQIDLYTGRSVS
jgi:hypothetical protein